MAEQQAGSATAAPTPKDTLEVRVHARRAEAYDVVSLELRAVSGEALPAFTAGAHIDLHIPAAPGSDGVPLVRQYSLANECQERTRYVIGVGRDAASRGGSVAVHERLRVGGELRISAPRNNFALVEAAPHSVLLAGGIGVTPLLAMARRLAALGRPWTLYYCVRTPERAAFLSELLALPGGRVVSVYDGLPGAARLDLAAMVQEAPADSHFYCCGPQGMIEAFLNATEHCGESRVHVEHFSAAPVAAADANAAQSYQVHLKRQGRSIVVNPGDSLLDLLLEAGTDVDYSCREGLCGTCETRVLCGTPWHSDPVYAARKTPPTDRMLVCVSRSAGGDLTLDL